MLELKLVAMMLIQFLPVFFDRFLVAIVFLISEQFFEVAFAEESSMLVGLCIELPGIVHHVMVLLRRWIVLCLACPLLVLEGPLFVWLVLISSLPAHHALLLFSVELLQIHIDCAVGVVDHGRLLPA